MDNFKARTHPQWTCIDTKIDEHSFFGKIRAIYSSAVLKAQLDQLKQSGCYDMFTGQWMPCYDTRRIYGAKALPNGLPPSLFWESDVGKWIESASYFLANSSSAETPYAKEFKQAIDKLVSEMEAFQQDDGYLNVYFTVVDPAGKFQNLRDMHEMYNAGHLLEGAIAHHKSTGSRRFLDMMIKNIDCFIKVFGSGTNQRPGYPGHPELELAVLRLYAITHDPRHLDFARHLLSARGTSPTMLEGKRFFIWEAEQRGDNVYGCWMKSKDDLAYHQSHLPLHEQKAILGHSVRAMYLLTACADFGGDFLDDARRMWEDAVHRKMYITGGFGSEPQSEGFSELAYYLPSATDEGGCYAETCASIAAMMLTERLLSHELNGCYQEILELCLYNAVLGGGSLDGKGFSYANKLATYGEECALRSEWFEVCCCPPNLSRTLGMLPGYIWSAKVSGEDVVVDVYLYISAERHIILPDGREIIITMHSEMPWTGRVQISVSSSTHTKVVLRLPEARWMQNTKCSTETRPHALGFVEVILDSSASPQVSITFDLETELIYPNARVKQDTLSVKRGPIVFVAEDIDNPELEESNPHFELVGIAENAGFSSEMIEVAGISVLKLTTQEVYTLDQQALLVNGGGHVEPQLWRSVRRGRPVRSWTKAKAPLTFVPWFARGNRGGKGHLRVPFLRIGNDKIV